MAAPMTDEERAKLPLVCEDLQKSFAEGPSVLHVLQGADLMVHPAYMESGGMVLIEGVIAGLPVIASGVCGFAHYISDAEAGVVLDEPFAQQQLNEAVIKALDDPQQRRQWSANGVEFGRQHDEIYDMPAHALACVEATIERVKARNRAAFEENLLEDGGRVSA